MIEKVLDEILLTTLQQIRLEKIDLLTQESAKKIAVDQGKISGQEQLISVMSLVMPNLEIRKTADLYAAQEEEPLDFKELEDKDIDELVSSRRELEKSPEWQKVVEAVLGKISEIKSFLVTDAGSGRDLFFAQGEVAGLLCYIDYFSSLAIEADGRAQKKREELPFGGDNGVNMVSGKGSKKKKAEDIPGFGVEEKVEEAL